MLMLQMLRGTSAVISIAIALASPVSLLAQASPPPPARVFQLMVNQLNGRVYSASGPSTSNNSTDGFIIGKTSVLLFDTKNTVDDQRALNAMIAKITEKPIKYVFLSHSDGDHVNGLPTLPANVTVFAHDYAAKTMRDAAAADGPRAPDSRYLPQRTFASAEALTLDGVRIELHHWAPGHTGGDLVLFLPDDRIVFMGDLVISEVAEPFMHMDNGGSPIGVLRNMEGMAALKADIYVSGHGPIITRAELLRRIMVYRAKIDRVRSLAAEGRTLAEIKSALGEPPLPPAVPGRPNFDFTANIYTEAKN